MGTPCSLRDLAKRLGTSHVALRRLVLAGTITSGVRHEGGKVEVTDGDAAAKDWLEKVDRSRAPAYVRENADRVAAEIASKGGRPKKLPEQEIAGAEIGGEENPIGIPPLAVSAAKEKYYRAEKARMDVVTRAGGLVERARVRQVLEGAFRACRTKLLGLPPRLRQELPHLSAADAELVERLVREALEDLADSSVLADLGPAAGVGEDEGGAEA